MKGTSHIPLPGWLNRMADQMIQYIVTPRPGHSGHLPLPQPAFFHLLRTLRHAWALLLLTAGTSQTEASDIPVLSGSARISLLTCTPGPDLYSVFGHSAIRVEDTRDGTMLDEVYNYGTFSFSDDFYWRFVQGRLDYTLSRSDFGTFQQDYLYTGRGIQSQLLLLDSADRQRLYELLVVNYRPQNRTYRYDYFLDNCSSRIRDVVAHAAGGELKFTHVMPGVFSFRDAINRYLCHMPWSDFGIDLALGLPCDQPMEAGQVMFLPDSLHMEFSEAIYGEGALCTPSEELLPAEYAPEAALLGSPVQVMCLVLLIQAVVAIWLKRSDRMISLFDRLMLAVSGLVGCVILFLWLGTDHHAAAWNMNILWASPFNLIWAFWPTSAVRGWLRVWMTAQFVLLIVLLISWFFLPQDLHEASFLFALGLAWISYRMSRMARRGGAAIPRQRVPHPSTP